MLRYVVILIIFAIGVPLVMLSLATEETVTQTDGYSEDAFVEQEAPFSAVSL